MRRASETSPGVSPEPESLERLPAGSRRRNHWPWILFGLLVGGGAGVVSLEPQVVRELPRPSFLAASFRAGPPAPTPASAVAVPLPVPAAASAPAPAHSA